MDNMIRALLIEDDPDDVFLIRETLSTTPTPKVELETASTLEAGIERLAAGDVDVVLLDLSLPDSHGLDSFVRVHAQAPSVPVIILTGYDDESFALEAVSQGAQDYLVKGNVNSKMLGRVIRYAIERNRTQAELRNLSLVDELTGLYNRRGFMTFAEQYLKLAQRKNKGLLLVFTDLDNLKQINDTYGHHEGDLALIRTAKTLRETFRKSDLIGRIGGDEFPIMAMEADRTTADTIKQHLQRNLEKYNAQTQSRYKLSLSVGVAYLDPDDLDSSIDDLMERADQALYEQKRQKSPALQDTSRRG
jgi:two-component system, cell cycle response regulator